MTAIPAESSSRMPSTTAIPRQPQPRLRPPPLLRSSPQVPSFSPYRGTGNQYRGGWRRLSDEIELSNPEPIKRGEDNAVQRDNLDVDHYINKELQEHEKSGEFSGVCTPWAALHVGVPSMNPCLMKYFARFCVSQLENKSGDAELGERRCPMPRLQLKLNPSPQPPTWDAKPFPQARHTFVLSTRTTAPLKRRFRTMGQWIPGLRVVLIRPTLHVIVNFQIKGDLVERREGGELINGDQ